MAQTLTGSYTRPAGLSRAGVVAIGLAGFDPRKKLIKTVTGVVDLTTTFGAAVFIARFDIRDTTTKYLETDSVSGDNLAGEIAGTISFKLPIPANVTERVKIANVVDKFRQNTNRWVGFLEYADGTIKAIGSQYGGEFLAGTNDSGGTAQDLNGYMLTMTTREHEYSDLYTLTGAGLTQYAAGIMPTV